MGATASKLRPKVGASDRPTVDVRKLTEQVRSGKEEEQLWAAAMLSDLAADGEYFARSVIAEAGAIQPLVGLLASGSTKCRTTAAAALGNLARGNAENQVAIFEANAVTPLVQLLLSGSEEGKASAATVLAYVASHGLAHQTAIEQAGAFPPLVTMLRGSSRDSSDEGKERAAGAIVSLVRLNPDNQWAALDAGVVAPLIELVSHPVSHPPAPAPRPRPHSPALSPQLSLTRPRPPTRARAQVASGGGGCKLWAGAALSALAADNEDTQTAISEAGGIPPLADLLRMGSDQSRVWAAAALGSIAENGPEWQQSIVNANAVGPLVELASSGAGQGREVA